MSIQFQRSSRLAPLLALAMVAAAQAQDSGTNSQPSAQPKGHGHPPGPPPEAVKACKGQAEGATVSFTLRDGRTLQGTCRTVNGKLAATPPNMGTPPSQ